MDAILLISKQRDVIEKWQPVLALNYSVSLSNHPKTEELERHQLLIIDSQIIDLKLFLLSKIKQLSAKCLVIGNQWPEGQQVEALAAGAAGYCEISISASMVLKAVESIAQNDVWIQRHLIHKVIGALVKLPEPSKSATGAFSLAEDKLACLSKRELDVAHLICQGVSNKSIAATLFISERTVKAHLTSIFSKLKVSNRLHLGLLLKETEE